MPGSRLASYKIEQSAALLSDILMHAFHPETVVVFMRLRHEAFALYAAINIFFAYIIRINIQLP